jgi:lysophospholipase L1-like esterase
MEMLRSTWKRRFACSLSIAICVCALVATGAVLGASARSPAPKYYVGLGDSLAEGFQPGYPSGAETLHGYANRVVTIVEHVRTLTLENFGCGGASAVTAIRRPGCTTGSEANDGVPYPTTSQLAGALAFIKAHHGEVRLVTVAIGGNDFAGCLGLANPKTCLAALLPPMVTNIEHLAAPLRAALGAGVPIIAINYFDVNLVDWIYGAEGRSVAKAWVAAFRDTVNPAFVRAYRASKVTLLDMTQAFGGEVSLSKMVTLAPYGRIPFAVARLCTLTWKCAKNNDHPRDTGYALIAAAIAKAYLKLAP